MSQLGKNSFVGYIAALFYLLVHFIPDFGGADVMGAQWLYVSSIDFLILVYLFLIELHSKRPLIQFYN